MRRALPVLLTVLFLGAATLAIAGKDQGPEVDRVAIAARLVSDGHHARAAAVLAEVDADDVAKKERVRFHTLSGLVALHLEQFDEAVAALGSAWATGDAEPLVQVYLARAHHGLGHHAAALEALDTAGEAADALPGAWQLRSRAHQLLGQTDAAYRALLAGRQRFPDHAGLAEDQLLLLVELGLTQQVVELGTELLGAVDASPETWIAVGDRLRRAKALDDALSWLEEARLRFPESTDARVALAQTCLEAERPLCCGEMLQEAAAFDHRFASEAAECYRRAGRLDRALYLNGEIHDPEVKVRQRLGLMLEAEEFTLAAALDPRLRRLGLLDDEQVTYALAYAHFRSERFDRAEELLAGLRDPALFQQGIALREAMARARDADEGRDEATP